MDAVALVGSVVEEELVLVQDSFQEMELEELVQGEAHLEAEADSVKTR